MKPITLIVVFVLCLVSSSAQFSGSYQNPATKAISYNAACGCLNVASSAALSVGDRVLLVQMQGASLSLESTDNFGYPQTPAAAGKFEFNTVRALNANSVTLAFSLRNTYDFQNGSVQLVKVMSGADITLGSLQASKWDGVTGGIIVAEATNSITVNGVLDASGCGFRGAQSVVGSYSCGIHDYYLSATSTDGAPKGEGISINTLNLRGRGAWANGGGGGNNHNAGGGGGSLAKAGGFGGFAWGNCSIRNDQATRGFGGFALNVSANDPRAFLGGGGGAGHRNDNNPSSGANGGGIIILVAKTINANAAQILCNGADALRCEMDGAGGGGAGGTVMLLCENLNDQINISIRGGKGGDARNPHGPGGGGSGGVLYLAHNVLPSAIQCNRNGGSNGMNYELGGSAVGFVAGNYGATQGEDGSIVLATQHSSSTQPSARINLSIGSNHNLCSGSSEQLRSVVEGGQAPYTYSWMPVSAFVNASVEHPQFVGTQSTGVSCTVRDSKGCVASDSIRITVAPGLSIGLDDSLAMCAGSVVTLDPRIYGGSGDVSVVWSPSTGLSATRALQVVANPTVSTTYTLTVQDRNGCIAVDSVYVAVRGFQQPTIVGDDSVCAGSQHIYQSGIVGQQQLLWSAQGCLSLQVDNKSNSAIIVWGSGSVGHIYVSGDAQRQCIGNDELLVRIVAQPQVSWQERKVQICEGDSAVLDAGSFARYAWSTGETTRRIVARKAGTYSVNVWNSFGCESSSTSQHLTVLPRPTPQLTQRSLSGPCTADEIELDAGVFSSYLWSNGQRSRTIIVRNNGVYSVSVSNAAGCSAKSDEIDVRVGSNRKPVLLGNTSVCAHAIEVYRANGLQDSYFSWNVDGAEDVTYMGSRNDSVRVQWNSLSPIGKVSVQENTTAGCTLASVLAVEIAIVTKPVIVANKTEIYAGDVAVLDAGAGYSSYLWTSGETTQTIQVKSECLVQVSVTNQKGCSEISKPLHIVVRPVDEARVQATRLKVCEGETISLSARSSVGTIKWNTKEQGASIVVRTSGQYFYSVHYTNGKVVWSDTVNTEVVRMEKPEIRRQAKLLVAPQAASYQWFLNGVEIPGATAGEYAASVDGRYSVLCTNELGCTAMSDNYSFQTVVRMRLSVPKLEAAAGTEIRVPVQVSFRDNTVLSMPMKVEFRLRVRSNALALRDGSFEHDYDNGDLVIKVSSLVTNNSVIEVPCLVLASDSTEVSIGLETVQTADSTDCQLQSGSLKIVGQCGRSQAATIDFGSMLRISKIYPNPSSERATVDFSLAESGTTVLRLVDLRGREVRRYLDGYQERGAHSVTLSVSDLESGNYSLVLEAPSRTTSCTLQVLR